MEASFYPTRNCWRVQVPARLNNGKRQSLYFQTQAEASAEIARRLNSRPALIEQSDEQFTQSLAADLGSRDKILRAVEHYKKTVLSIIKRGTVLDMCEEFVLWQKTQGLSRRTLSDDRYRVKRFALAFGNNRPAELAPSKIMAWVDSHSLGSNRRNMFKVAHKMLAWARLNGWVGVDLMEGLAKPRAQSAKEIIPIGDFERIVRSCAGIDPLADLPKNFKPRAGMPIIQDFRPVLPAFVLGGMAGLRTCELVKVYGTELTVHWEDIDWEEKWITVSHGVAKRTRRDSDLRYPTLFDAAIAWLRPVAKSSGPIVELTDSAYREYRRQLCARLGVEIPKNGLRNSFASYGLTFRALGDVARDMGDLEETVRQHYVQTLKPNSGRAWFDIRPAASKILPFSATL